MNEIVKNFEMLADLAELHDLKIEELEEQVHSLHIALLGNAVFMAVVTIAMFCLSYMIYRG